MFRSSSGGWRFFRNLFLLLPMSIFLLRRPEILSLLLRAMAGLLCLLFFSQCQTTSTTGTKDKTRKSQNYKITKKSNSGAYKKSGFSSEKLVTPSGHGMTKKQYPFDDQGNYRRDWVRSGSSSRTKSSRSGYKVASTQTSNNSGSTPPVLASPSKYPDYVGNTAPTRSQPSAPVPAPKPAPKPSTRYHKVASGDTLYSLSRKYRVSVSALQKTNGLSGNLIRTGQSLRIP